MGSVLTMALVVITVSDEDDGDVDVRSLFEPLYPMKDEAKATPAQRVAATMLLAVADQRKDSA